MKEGTMLPEGYLWTNQTLPSCSAIKMSQYKSFPATFQTLSHEETAYIKGKGKVGLNTDGGKL